MGLVSTPCLVTSKYSLLKKCFLVTIVCVPHKIWCQPISKHNASKPKHVGDEVTLVIFYFEIRSEVVVFSSSNIVYISVS